MVDCQCFGINNRFNAYVVMSKYFENQLLYTIIITGEIGILLRYFPFARYVYSEHTSFNNNIIKYHFACMLSFIV